MKSPLRKRIPRELRAELGKYLVVLILMISTIGFVSGFLVADGSMIQAYNDKIDIHTKTASEVFGTPLNEVSYIERSRAKAVNFGIVYGISDFSLSKDLGVTRNEAKEYIEIYFHRFLFDHQNDVLLQKVD